MEFTGLFFGISTIVVALIGAFAYGCGDFMGGRAAVRLSPSGAVALAQCAGVAVSVQAFLNGDGGFPSAHAVGAGLLGGTAYLIGVTTLYRGIAFGRIGIVAPVSGLVGIVLPLAGDLVLRRHIGGAQFGGILICCLAFVLLSTTRDPPEPGIAPHFSLRLGALSGLGFGAADLCVGMMVPEEAPAAVMVARMVGALIALNLLGMAILRTGALRYYAASSGQPSGALAAGLRLGDLWGMAPAAMLAVVAGSFDAVGHISYAHVATSGSMAVASALVALYPAVPVILAAVVLKERMFRSQYVGLAASAVGVAVIAQ